MLTCKRLQFSIKSQFAKQFKNKTSLVLVLAAEDKIAVISKVTYSQEKFELLGSVVSKVQTINALTNSNSQSKLQTERKAITPFSVPSETT